MNKKSNNMLRAENISKTFPGVQALDRLSFDLKKGEINAIVGENGAGKSTFIKILSGVYPQYEGKIYILGKEIRIINPRQARNIGISTVYQELLLVPQLTVAENIFLNRFPLRKNGTINWKILFRDTSDILNKLKIEIKPDEIVSDLSVSQMQMVEIAKAIAAECKVLIMDEPTSSLNIEEVRTLFNLILDLRDAGVSIIYISHRFKEVFEIADRLTIFRDGKNVGTLNKNDFSFNRVCEMMIGQNIRNYFHKDKVILKDEILSLKNFSLKGVFKDINLCTHKGEIVGIYGLLGSGRSELLQTIFGLYKNTEGKIYINSNLVKINSPGEAISSGLGFVPEDKKEAGLFLRLSIIQNISILNLDQRYNFFIFRDKHKKELEKYLDIVLLKYPNLNTWVQNLSGGNQQKVVLAKWLSAKPKILLLDEPSKGIDVRTRAEIYQLITKLARSGMSVLLVSSDIQEICRICDRVYIMHEGRLVKELYDKEIKEEMLVHYSSGVEKEEEFAG